jgi:predicted nucleic acid-binding protein
MTAKPTLDTNILIYAFGHQDDARKHIAIEIISQCNIISSEDLHHNQVIDGRLKIINPFTSLK